MDVYMNSGESLSLQEMLDVDYKTGLDGVFPSVDLGLSLTEELSPLDLEDAFGDSDPPAKIKEEEDELVDMTAWFANNGFSANNNSSFTLDLVNGDVASMMVNPNSVMPVTLVTLPASAATTNNNVYVTSAVSSTEDIIKIASPSPSSTSGIESSSSGTSVAFARTLPSASSTTSSAISSQQQNTVRASIVRTASTNTVTGVRIAAASSTSHAVHADVTSSGMPSILTTAPRGVPVVTSSTKFTQPQKPVTHIQVTTSDNPSNSRTINVQTQLTHTKRGQHVYNSSKHYPDFDFDDKAYPKPAYSYSCLIAMALKNSKTGSLPVSEIYNFMCEHFPYFKTAPNGWKNSVRHNLSLNKCFEKIEKPSGNGSHQRKGCLWAMNPAKVAKMDEEVQKWSKKDPMAIKKAMICPENLEMLERGEMKRDYVGFIGNGMLHSPSGTDESDDMEVPDVGSVTDNVEIICSEPNTPHSPVSVHELPEFIDIATVADELDDASLNDFDIEVTDDMYEELEIEDEKLNLGVTLASTPQAAGLLTSMTSTTLTLPVITSSHVQTVEYVPPAKRGRPVTSTIQGNYVYKPVVSVGSAASTSRRKTPILLRASSGASSFIKLEDP